MVEKLSYAAIPDKIRTALSPALHPFIPTIAKPQCALFSADGECILPFIYFFSYFILLSGAFLCMLPSIYRALTHYF